MDNLSVCVDVTAPDGRLEVIVQRVGKAILQRSLDDLVRELVADCDRGLPLRPGDLVHVAAQLEELATELLRMAAERSR
jgi:hypothetical protein